MTVKELRKKIKDAEAQKIMLQMLISEYDDKAIETQKYLKSLQRQLTEIYSK